MWFSLLSIICFFYRAGIPAWLEIIKRNINQGKRERCFSWSSGLAYGEGVLLSIGIGALLDHKIEYWKFLCFVTAAIGTISIFLLSKIQVAHEVLEERENIAWKELIIRPWRDSWNLLQKRPDFSCFQWGFMFCGFGIMLIQPALPLLAVDLLNVSYVEMAVALSVAKGLGFSLSSSMWARLLQKLNIFQVASIVFFSVGLFPLLLTLAPNGLWWFYLAYFWYGVGQGGSHLVWNMSGPIFAAAEDSSRFTGVNVVLAGLRGAICPGLGSMMAVMWGPLQVFFVSSLFCFFGGSYLMRKKVPLMSSVE